VSGDTLRQDSCRESRRVVLDPAAMAMAPDRRLLDHRTGCSPANPNRFVHHHHLILAPHPIQARRDRHPPNLDPISLVVPHQFSDHLSPSHDRTAQPPVRPIRPCPSPRESRPRQIWTESCNLRTRTRRSRTEDTVTPPSRHRRLPRGNSGPADQVTPRTAGSAVRSSTASSSEPWARCST
jgi:hypothetical protein